MLRGEGAVDDDAGLGLGDGPQEGFRGVRPWGTRTRIWRGLVTVTSTLARRLARGLERGLERVAGMAVVEWLYEQIKFIDKDTYNELEIGRAHV